MSVCHRDILSSLSTVDLLRPLGYGSHCREGINGNPVLTLDYFSLRERLDQSLVRSIASPFDYARVPSSEGNWETTFPRNNAIRGSPYALLWFQKCTHRP
jgi:hypothetical protein